jgi:hypothetical protein
LNSMITLSLRIGEGGGHGHLSQINIIRFSFKNFNSYKRIYSYHAIITVLSFR